MFNITATKISREKVEIEMTEDELVRAASSNLSNKSIVKILKSRLVDDIEKFMKQNDSELRPDVGSQFIPPKAHLRICLESGFVTKVYNSPYNSIHAPVRTLLDAQYLRTLAVFNQLAGMGPI